MLFNDRYFARKENRRETRRKIQADGWIKFDGAFAARQCKVIDMSVGGAMISGVRAESLSRTFLLGFSRDCKGAKRCTIAWKENGLIGVKFV